MFPLLAAGQSATHTLARGCFYSLFRPVPRDSLQELRPDRPGVSESPFTVDAGHFQLETDLLRLVNNDQQAHHERDFRVNQALLKIGLSTRTDLQIGLDSYTWEKQWDDDREPERHQGFGDLTVRVKRTLLGGAPNQPAALGIIGLVHLPVGPEVGLKVPEYGLVVPFSYDFSKEFNLQVQVLSNLNYDGEQGHRFLLLAPSTAIDYEFSPKISAFAELASFWDTRQQAWQASFNLGPQLHIGDNVILDGGTHLALTRDTDQEYFLGLSFRI
ncbi:Putative MetA-pathway of phenol degradation [Hymenobacter daecheongensis DSM 21074]|uniref:Putative MetA-pathway of phenol degradation n=1 Tax=Hymenobacter daecheongensis DSM 21074 TaxID=1121955 RepID=A0A1M6LIW1_9BACT|nr:Putative MetA-pathway of phenol degradation [Hymenobacter daecheongensis DSM 21074]